MSDETTAAMYDALRMYHEAKARAEKAERELVERTRERDAAREALRELDQDLIGMGFRPKEGIRERVRRALEGA